jgi:hypothetical protein
MTAITLEAFRSRIRDVGDYNNEDVFPDSFLDEQINDAIGEYCDLLDDKNVGYRDTTTTLVTVAGTATVELPDDFHKARAVDLLYDGRYRKLARLTNEQTYGFERYGNARPVGYMRVGGDLELFPTPDTVYTLRLRYVPEAAVLVEDDDAIDIPNRWERFVIYTVLAVLDEAEERDSAPRLRVVAMIKARIEAAATQPDTSGPTYLPMPGEGFEDEL